MRKFEELSISKSCMSRAGDDEMTFVLLGRDECAPLVIRTWCGLRVGMGKNRWDDEQIQEALRCAEIMIKERVRSASASGEKETK